MNRSKRALFLLFTLAQPWLAHRGFAKGGVGSTSILAHVGQTAFSGGLSDESGSTWGLSLLLHQPYESTEIGSFLYGLSGHWLLDFSNTSVKARHDPKFPFTPDKSLTIFESTIVPNICAMAKLPVQACLGFGWAQMAVSGSDNRQNYGAFRSDLKVGHYRGRGLVGGLEINHRSVEQKVAGVESDFSALTYQGSLGWQW